MDEQFRQDNLDNWNARVGIHVASKLYGLDRFRDDASFISPVVAFDAPALGPLTGLSVAHLQCHIGTDTVSLARLGAKVTGLDFSGEAIAAARAFGESVGCDAQFVQGDVYDAEQVIGTGFDWVYTTVGVLGWLDDIDAWATAVAAILASGGRLYVRDMHPFLWVYEEVDSDVLPTYPYITPAATPLSLDEDQTYSDGDGRLAATRCHSWNHPVSSVINALVNAGMVIEQMQEMFEIDWPAVPSCVPTGDGRYRLPEPLHGKVPCMFALTARKV